MLIANEWRHLILDCLHKQIREIETKFFQSKIYNPKSKVALASKRLLGRRII